MFMDESFHGHILMFCHKYCTLITEILIKKWLKNRGGYGGTRYETGNTEKAETPDSGGDTLL